MPRISSGEAMLTGALNDLRRDWEMVRSDWRDKARMQFEKEYIEQILPDGLIAARAMAELTLLLRKVVRECS